MDHEAFYQILQLISGVLMIIGMAGNLTMIIGFVFHRDEYFLTGLKVMMLCFIMYFVINLTIY